ncbi:MAG: dTMP kinase [Gemmatimonadota bacterium]|nr:dTMP kinase [Gemmatimonadota bacterium]
MQKGLFISIEGCEGAGKSTQVGLLSSSLGEAGYKVLCVREPGGTAVSEKIRDILLDKAHQEITPRVELLLYLASRAQLVSQVIVPALEGGRIVITDRFHDSTLAYQAGARGLEVETVRRMNLFATGGVLPEVTFLLDLPPGLGFGRKGLEAGQFDRMEGQGNEFHQRVRETFLELAELEPGRVQLVDARKPAGQIARTIMDRVMELLGKKL